MIEETTAVYEIVYGLFAGIGALILIGVFAYLIYQMTRAYKQMADKNEVYNDTEIIAVTDTAKKLGIDLQKYHIMQNKDFAKRLEEETIKEYFEKNQEKK